MKIEFNLESNAAKLQGFAYFWLKRINGFNPAVHCAKCLNGVYESGFGRSMPTNKPVLVNAEAGELFYLCGVSTPYRWEHNAHLALIAEEGATVWFETYRGDVITIKNAKAIPFDDKAAKRLFPNRGAAFLTCRNFQFGAQHFENQETPA